MRNSTRGFTLIEILVALMLTGMLTTLALAPVVITVRRVVETQEEYSDISALSRTMNFIARDLYSAMRLAANVITIKDDKALGGNDDDTLMMMTTSPTAQNLPSGTVIYRIEDGGIMRNSVIPGLYRWIVPGKAPNAVKLDDLEPEDGQLVLPGVNEFCVEVPTGTHEDDRRKDYAGPLPNGIYIKIGRYEEDTVGMSKHEEGELDELENFIVFP